MGWLSAEAESLVQRHGPCPRRDRDGVHSTVPSVTENRHDQALADALVPRTWDDVDGLEIPGHTTWDSGFGDAQDGCEPRHADDDRALARYEGGVCCGSVARPLLKLRDEFGLFELNRAGRLAGR